MVYNCKSAWKVLLIRSLCNRQYYCSRHFALQWNTSNIVRIIQKAKGSQFASFESKLEICVNSTLGIFERSEMINTLENLSNRKKTQFNYKVANKKDEKKISSLNLKDNHFGRQKRFITLRRYVMLFKIFRGSYI